MAAKGMSRLAISRGGWLPLVIALALAGPAATAGAATALPGRLHTLTPTRIVDTRSGLGGLSRLGPMQAVTVPVAGLAGVPADAAGVVLQVTADRGSETGFFSVFPAGAAVPMASTVNWTPGRPATNLTVVALGQGGVGVFNMKGSVDLILDVTGWVAAVDPGDAAGGLHPLYPARILDTREGGARLGPGQVLTVPVAGHGNVPATAAAALLNLTVTNPTDLGFLTVYPHGTPRPANSNLNFVAGETRAGRVLAALPATADGGGAVDVYNATGTADLVVDVSGWLDTDGTGAGLTLVPPARLLDTRAGGPLAAGATRSLPVAGVGGVPQTGAGAVLLNLTAVDAAGPGFANVFSGSLPLASDLDYPAADAVPNLVVLPLAADGTVTLAAHAAPTQLVVDLLGWFGSAPAGAVPGAPVITSAGPVPNAAAATVAWQPATSPDSQVVAYTITALPGAPTNPGSWGGSPGGMSAGLGGGDGGGTISGLTCGGSYTFTVTASNGFGSGPASAPSAPVAIACPTTRTLAVPMFGQIHSLDCEAAALQMALAFTGVSVSQDTILGAIGIDGRAPVHDASGLHWGDPYAGFVGDVNGFEDSWHGALSGYGTYYPRIAAAAQAFGAQVLGAGEGVTPSQVYGAVLAGHPVVAWVSYDWTRHATSGYYAFDGRLVLYGAPFEHAVTVVGVTPDSVEVNNPAAGVQWISRATFEAAYATFNQMAVILG